MRKFILYIYMVLLLAVGFIVVSGIVEKKAQLNEPDNSKEVINEETNNIREEEHNFSVEQERVDIEAYKKPSNISKAVAAKMIALCKEDKRSIQTRDREINFNDSSEDAWFDVYINVGVVEGWIKANGEKIYPLALLTYGDLSVITDYFDIDYDTINRMSPESIVSTEDWFKVFNAISSMYEEKYASKRVKLYVFATPEIGKELKPWELVSDQGKYYFEGLNMNGCMNKEVEVLIRDNDILWIYNVNEEGIPLKNAYIEKVDIKEQYAIIFMGGMSRTIPLEKGAFYNQKEGIIGDVVIKDNKITSILQIQNSVHGKVNKIKHNSIEVDGIGTLDITEDTKFYSTYRGLAFRGYRSVIVGYDTSKIYIDKNNQVAAIEIVEKPKIENIRVALNTTGFKGIFHKHVTIASDNEITLIHQGEISTIKAGKGFSTEQIDIAIGDRIHLVPAEGEKLQVLSIRRGWGSDLFNPSYRGSIEIERAEDGYIIVNEVAFEPYLYSVVPSEMPTSYGVEALKVQAICARSYAYSQFYSNRYCEYGAHVDDSTSSQVYNNMYENDTSIQAVNSTKGMMLSYNDNIVSTKYYSTSCGVTSNSGDVWADWATKEFPTQTSAYYLSTYQSDTEGLKYNLTTEEGFRSFINDKTQETFDSQYSWFRWKTTMTKEQLEASINKSIKMRYEASPKMIKTLFDDNTFRSRDIDGIGELKDIKIYARGNSGIITFIIIEGTGGTYKVGTEYNVRKLLAPTNYTGDGKAITITRNNGKKTNDMSLMPSAYFYMNKRLDAQGNLTSIEFIGGGYGHGVGMSQNGVKAMVDKGYTFTEILDHYYKGTVITIK